MAMLNDQMVSGPNNNLDHLRPPNLDVPSGYLT